MRRVSSANQRRRRIRYELIQTGKIQRGLRPDTSQVLRKSVEKLIDVDYELAELKYNGITHWKGCGSVHSLCSMSSGIVAERVGRVREELADRNRILAVAALIKNSLKSGERVNVKWVISLKKVANRMQKRIQKDTILNQSF
jgi:hypothetical protein